jgi:hypothetical protein
MREKGRKVYPTGAIILVKGVQIRIERCRRLIGSRSIHPVKETMMGRTDKKNQPPGKSDREPGKSPPTPVADDDVEDGDFATPKRDRHGDDDEPL